MAASKDASDYSALFKVIDDHVKQYENGTIIISDDIDFSMRQTVRQITHYILSRYMGGQTDKLKRRKPFRNIGNAIVDLEWRAKNIDRKSIEGHPTDGDHVFALIVNKELQKWMRDTNFGKVIDDYQRKKSEYGSVLMKKTETKDDLTIEPCKWEYTAVDARDIAGGIKVERNYLSPLDLVKKKGIWNDDEIDAAIKAAKKQVNHDENRIEVEDIEGEFDNALFDGVDAEGYSLRNVIRAIVGNKKFCLYETKLTESRYKHDKRKDVEGRDMALGVWEEIFEPQIWTNEAVISEKFAMDLGGRVVIKTNKKTDVPSAASLMDGEIIELEANEFFDPVSLAPEALPEYARTIDGWFVNMQRDQSAYPGMTGEEPKAGAPAQSLMLQAAQGGSIFNKRRDQDGFFIVEMLNDWVLKFLVKLINKDHVLTASYSAKELELIDEATAEFLSTRKIKDRMLAPEFTSLNTPAPTQEDKDMIASDVRAQLQKQGDTRTHRIPKGYITLQRITDKVQFDITDEMLDDQRKLNALATTLQNMAPEDPQRPAIIKEMMAVMGLSAGTYPIAGAPAASAAAPQSKQTAVNSVLPQGQQA